MILAMSPDLEGPVLQITTNSQDGLQVGLQFLALLHQHRGGGVREDVLVSIDVLGSALALRVLEADIPIPNLVSMRHGMKLAVYT